MNYQTLPKVTETNMLPRKVEWLPCYVSSVDKNDFCREIGVTGFLNETAHNIIRPLINSSIERLPKTISLLDKICLGSKDEEDQSKNKGLKRYKIFNDKDDTVGYLYFVENDFEGKIHLLHLKERISYLIKNCSSYLYCLNRLWADGGLLIMFLSEELKPISESTRLIQLTEYQDIFILECLEAEDILDLNGEPKIINPEKVLLKDGEAKDIEQKLQFHLTDGQFKCVDYTSEKDKQKIFELKIRETLRKLAENSNQ